MNTRVSLLGEHGVFHSPVKS